MEAMDKVRDEMAKNKGGQITVLGEGVTALLGIHPEVADKIAAEGKTLKGCLEAICKAAKGGVADAVASTKAICAYYGIEADANRLAVEVNLAMLGDDLIRRFAPPSPEGEGKQCDPGRVCHEGEGNQCATGRAYREGEGKQSAPEDEFDLDKILGGLCDGTYAE